jgi:2-C-methyl-D-erythritol 4-phosphate cytidylyltransferase
VAGAEARVGIGVVVVAAGTGTRLGHDGPKALVEVAGAALVAHALDRLAAAGLPAPVVVHPPGERDRFAAAVRGRAVARWVAGGASRTDSVRAGLAALDAIDTGEGDVEVVAVHDAARGLQPAEVLAAAVAAVVTGADVIAAAPALPVADTLKRVDGDEVLGTVDRAGVAAVQTPQVFPSAVLRHVLADGAEATDDLALVEAARDRGELTGRIVLVPGAAAGGKITYPQDLLVAAALAGGEAAGDGASAPGTVGRQAAGRGASGEGSR